MAEQQETTEQRLARLERDFSNSMGQIARSLAEQEGVLYDHGALLRQLGADQRNQLREIREMKASIEGMATKADLEELRTQVLDSFTHLLAILDERLPIIRDVQSEGE